MSGRGERKNLKSASGLPTPVHPPHGPRRISSSKADLALLQLMAPQHPTPATAPLMCSPYSHQHNSLEIFACGPYIPRAASPSASRYLPPPPRGAITSESDRPSRSLGQNPNSCFKAQFNPAPGAHTHLDPPRSYTLRSHPQAPPESPHTNDGLFQPTSSPSPALTGKSHTPTSRLPNRVNSPIQRPRLLFLTKIF